MIDMKYGEILKANKLLEDNDKPIYKIAVLSNIMVHQSKEICEYILRFDGINASIELGDYDNIVRDSIKFKDSNVVLIFWEIYNFIDGLQYKAELLSTNELNELINKIKMEIDIVLNNLNDTSLVIINKFSSLIFNQYLLNNNKMDFMAQKFL